MRCGFVTDASIHGLPLGGSAMSEAERRKAERELSSVLKRQLNPDQLETLRGLESFGWELKFIRRKPFQPPVAVIFDGDRKNFAVLEPDGTLNEHPDLVIRP
jgi:hypothetical protein